MTKLLSDALFAAAASARAKADECANSLTERALAGESVTDTERAHMRSLGTAAQDAYANAEAQRQLEVVASTAGLNLPQNMPAQLHASRSDQDSPGINAIADVLRHAVRGDALTDETMLLYGGREVRTGDGHIQIPLDLIGRAQHDMGLSQRANDATTASEGSQPLLADFASAFVHAMPVIGEHWGVSPEAVPPGQREYGWIKAVPPATMAAEDAMLAQIDVVATVLQRKVLTPKRTYAAGGFTVESGATWGNAAQAIVSECFASIADKLEEEALNGDGVAPNYAGIAGRATDKRAAAATVDTWATVVAAVTGLIDGKYSSRLSDLRLVTHPETNAFLATLVSSPGGDTTVTDYLDMKTGGLRVSAHAPDPTDSGNLHTLYARRGNRPNSFAWPTWSSLNLIVDSVTTAGVGTRIIAWTVSDFYLPGADEQRQDFVEINLRSAV